MEHSFNFGLISVLVGACTAIGRYAYVKGYNNSLIENNNPAPLNHLDLTGSTINIAAIVIVVLGFLAIHYLAPEPLPITSITNHQAADIVSLEGEIFKNKVLKIISSQLQYIDQNKEIDFVNVKEDIVGLSKRERFKLTRLNFKLESGEFLSAKLEVLYPVESLRNDFERLRPILTRSDLSKAQKMQKIEDEITSIQNDIKTKFLQNGA